MVSRPVTKGVAAKASKSSEGVGIGDRSTPCEKVTKLISCCDGGKRAVRDQTSGVLGTKSVGSGGRLAETEQEVVPLRASRSANKGEVLSETPARFVI